MIAARNDRCPVKRCAIYIRVSTAMQRMEGWSLKAQESSLRATAKANGWKVVGVYADEGKSARKRLKDRKEIHRLLADVRSGQIDIILFKELDRWFRSVSDFYKVQDVLDAAGVTWVSERQPNLGMATKEDRLQVNLLLSVGQNETDSTSDRIKYTNKFLRQQKRWTSGPSTLPRGHMLDDEQRVHIDPDQEPYVRELISNFMQLGSIRGALVKANEAYGETFGYNNAKALLRNPFLYGAYKEVPDFVEKPYLTREEFNRMQDLMTRNARSDTKRLYIFAGLIKCPLCGKSMIGNTRCNSGKDYRYYRCTKAKMSGLCENTRNVNEAQIEQQLLDFVREAVQDQIARVTEVKQQTKQRKPRKSNRGSIDRQLDKLEDVYISSDRMTKERYEAKRQAILAKLIEEDEPEEKLPELADLKKIQALFDSGVDQLYLGFTPEERREFWRGILTRIEVQNGQVVDVDFIDG